MPVWLKVLALIPMWCGLDLMIGHFFGQPRGIFHLSDLLWNLLIGLTGSRSDAMLAMTLLGLVSLIVIIVNLALPTKA